MKNIIKWIFRVVIVLYVILGIFVTVCLMNYNDYKVTELGNTSLLIMDSDEFKEYYEKGSLVVVKRPAYDDVKKGDMGLFYNSYESPITVTMAKITDKEVITPDEQTYTLAGDKDISSDFFIGTTTYAKEYKGVGKVLSVLESKWGFLLLIVLPVLVAFIYEIYAIIREFIHPSEEED